MGVHGVCYSPTELVIYTSTYAVRRHECHIHFHLIRGVSITALFIPLVLVLTFFGRFGIQLEGVVRHCEFDCIFLIAISKPT